MGASRDCMWASYVCWGGHKTHLKKERHLPPPLHPPPHLFCSLSIHLQGTAVARNNPMWWEHMLGLIYIHGLQRWEHILVHRTDCVEPPPQVAGADASCRGSSGAKAALLPSEQEIKPLSFIHVSLVLLSTFCILFMAHFVLYWFFYPHLRSRDGQTGTFSSLDSQLSLFENFDHCSQKQPGQCQWMPIGSGIGVCFSKIYSKVILAR